MGRAVTVFGAATACLYEVASTVFAGFKAHLMTQTECFEDNYTKQVSFRDTELLLALFAFLVVKLVH